MTKEQLLRKRCEEMAKELAVACAVLGEWNRQGDQIRDVGIAAPDFPVGSPATLRFHVDEAVASHSAVTIQGWAFVPMQGNPPGASHAIYVRAPAGGWLAFAACPMARPDVAQHFAAEAGAFGGLERSGFYGVLPRHLWGETQTEIELMIVEQTRHGFWARSEAIAQRMEADPG